MPQAHVSCLGRHVPVLILCMGLFSCTTLGLGGSDATEDSEEGAPNAKAVAALEARFGALESRLGELERKASLTRQDFTRFQHDVQDIRTQFFTLRKRGEIDARRRRSGLALDFDEGAAARVEEREKASQVAPLPVPAGQDSDDDTIAETALAEDASPARMTDQAEERMRLSRYGEAVLLLTDVQTRFPQFDDGGRSLVLLADGWLKLGEPHNALPAVRQVYTRFPTSARFVDAKLLEARAQEKLGARQKALGLYREVLASHPESVHGQEARAALARMREAL
jgi:TolA-binding protein